MMDPHPLHSVCNAPCTTIGSYTCSKTSHVVIPCVVRDLLSVHADRIVVLIAKIAASILAVTLC